MLHQNSPIMEKEPRVEKDLDKEQERQRFLDYIGPKPDLTELAEKTGLNRQSLYYVTTGARYVTGEIHKAMAKAFPDYDLVWHMMGIRPEAQVEAQSRTDDRAMSRLQTEIAKLRIENDYLKLQRDEASEEKAKYWKLLETLHTQKLDFSAVSDQTTDTLFPDYPVPPKANPKFSDFRQIGPKKPVSPTWYCPGINNLGEPIHE